MSIDAVSAEYMDGYKIRITFDNGKIGIMDFEKYVTRNGIYRKLNDLNCFKQFKIDGELGVLTWENGIDIAPETLYSEATGEPLPQWMSPNDT